MADAFTWDALCSEQVEPGEWYMVAFRSIRRPGVDEGRLTAYDDWAHTEAMGASGFVHYFKGPTTADGRCMSFCLWDSRAEARAAAGRPAHTEAAALTHEAYAEYTLEFHRVRRLAGAEGFTFEPYDAVGPPTLSRTARHRAGSPRASHRPDARRTAIAQGRDRSHPGSSAAIVVAAVARLVTGFLPSIVAEVSVALLIGIVVAAVAGPRLRRPDSRPALRLAAGPAARHRPARGPPEPGRDRPDRPAGDRAHRRDDGRLVRDRPGRWHGSSTSMAGWRS